MKKKLIFLDIDGTLTEPGHADPPASALRAIENARQNGHLVFLCTGRNYSMLDSLLKYDFDGIICSAGGYIIYNKEVLYDCPMTEEQRLQAFQALDEIGVYRTLECLNGSYSDDGFKKILKGNNLENANSELKRWEEIEKVLNIRPISAYAGEPVYKIIVMSQEQKKIQEVKERLSADFDLVVQDAFGPGILNGELINRKFHKGKSVERICQFLQIPIEDTISFGDSMNDKEMLETTGLGICMENGSAGLKAVADEICPPVGQDGLWKAFQKLGLMEGIEE